MVSVQATSELPYQLVVSLSLQCLASIEDFITIALCSSRWKQSRENQMYKFAIQTQ